MRIKRLDIMGFKSFPERVQVPLPAGISAVVGPNGCGKSNIVDAIRWVMGEQSPKQLRGRNMDDVLFNGAKTHQAAGMAEVTMVLSNENGHGPGADLGPSEISITRRLYRSGDSDYLINKVPCRLKDITQFFMDTGMGTKAYAIIEQGRIGWLVDARPEERRALIDEAAGITRYKAQKKEAERKIEATEQNLTHVNVQMAETKRQLNSLTRAANKAARYKEFKAELKGIDLVLTSRELKSLENRNNELTAQKQDMENRLQMLLTGLERMELELENIRLQIVEQEKAAEAKSAALYELQNEYNSLKQEDEFCQRQAGENTGRQARLREDLVRLGEQKEKQSGELERLQAEMASFRAEVEEKKKARDELRAAWTDLKREHDLAVGRRNELNREMSESRSRMARLEEIVAGHERMSMSHEARRDEIMTELDQLRVENSQLHAQSSGLEQERESLTGRMEAAKSESAALREQMAAQRSESQRLSAEERRVDSELAAMKSKLATLKDVQAAFKWYPEGVQALMADHDVRVAGVLGPVAERLNVPPGFEAAVEAALGERLQYILVKNREAAAYAVRFLKEKNHGRCGFISLADIGSDAETDLTAALIGPYTMADNIDQAVGSWNGNAVLTKEGDYFGAAGLIVGGGKSESDRGLLARLKEIDELESRVDGLESEKQRLTSMVRESDARVEAIGAAATGAEETVQSIKSSMIEIDKQLSGFNARRGDLEKRLSSSNRALENQAAEAQRLSAETEAARSERESLESEEFDLQVNLESAEERVNAISMELDEARELGQEASMEVNTLSERLSTSERELSRTREWLADIQSQTASKEQELLQAESDLGHLEERRKSISASLEGFTDKLVSAENAAAEQKKLVDELRSSSNARENETRQSRKKREEINDQIRKSELDLQEISFKRQDHLNRIENEYRLDMNDLPEEERKLAAEDIDVTKSEARRSELRKKIEGMGEVNLTAIGEYDALKERYDFYATQYEDLVGAIDNLKSSIARINRTCKIRFKSTFEAVDQKLREIFPLLFEGGEAWLQLTDESDPLDSGVEIHVHPPGKKLTVMSLLSGGEKALVALALIFALYLIKPSPFCLLDETDAPLDEANIDRFNRLLKKLGQSSQIIMVTHNKRTMQISETLYGVTMEIPGVSKMVSVNLSEFESMENNAEMVQAG